MEKSRQEIIELTELLLALRPNVEKELIRSYPNVTSVEIGFKRKKGDITNIICFRVRVKKKVNENELSTEALIPKEIRGIPTDVLIELEGVNCEDGNGYDLLSGGIRIDAGIGTGTLGCFVSRDAEPAASKKVYLLTNHHVIIGSDGDVGKRVGQPSSPSSSDCCLCYDIAKVFCGEVGTAAGTATTIGTVTTPAGAANAIDAAIAKLLGQEPGDPKTVYFSNSIEQIGPVFGSAAPALGDRVRKRGQRTELTYGFIESLSVTFNDRDKKNPNATPVTYPANTILVTPLSENALMANEGDSGSVIVNSLNQVVGLVFAMPSSVGADGQIIPGGGAIACNIQTVMSRLGISVMSTGTASSIPLSGISEAKIKPIRAGNYINEFEKQIRSIPQGEMFFQILLDHRNEVMDLINDNREVKLAWHRLNGPEYIGHILKNFTDPKHPVPAEINGYSLQNLLIKMSDVLERNGSTKLAKAVDDYSAFAFSFTDRFKGINSLKNALKNFPLCPKCGKPIHQEAHAD